MTDPTPPPLATSTDLASYLDEAVNDPRMTNMLTLAQNLVEVYVSNPPAAAKGIVLAVAARAYSNPAQAHSIAMHSTSMQFGSPTGMPTGGLYLTRTELRALLRMSGSTGAFSISRLPQTNGQPYTMPDLWWWDQQGLPPTGTP